MSLRIKEIKFGDLREEIQDEIKKDVESRITGNDVWMEQIIKESKGKKKKIEKILEEKVEMIIEKGWRSDVSY